MVKMDERLKKIKSAVDAKRIIVRQYRITIPKKHREELGIKDKSVLESRVKDGIIYLRVVKV